MFHQYFKIVFFILGVLLCYNIKGQSISSVEVNEVSLSFHYGTNHSSSSAYEKTFQGYNFGLKLETYLFEEKLGFITGFEGFKSITLDSIGVQYGEFTSFANQIAYNPLPSIIPVYLNIGLSLTFLGENSYNCLFGGPQLIQFNWTYGFEIRKIRIGNNNLIAGFQYSPLDIDPSRFGNISINTIYLKFGLNLLRRN